MRADYLDTSAWAKQFLTFEEGSERMAALWDSSPALVTSDLTRVEMLATLARLRGSQLNDARWKTARRGFLRAWDEVAVVPTDGRLMDRAAYFAELHTLRAADAIHFAAAFSLNPAVRLVASDKHLLKAASAAGLATFDPAAGPT